MPEGFNLNRKIVRQLEAKKQVIETGEGIDWATAEAFAFGTLCAEGTPCGYRGQDSGRGTFSQRHSVLVDQETEDRYIPLDHVRDGQAPFEVVDSPLSEAAVLGFEYGYTLADPHALVLLGSAVRRFRQWRAGHHRSVHRLGRSQMAAHVAASCCSCPTAMKARDRSIPRRVSSVISSSAAKTIGRSAT